MAIRCTFVAIVGGIIGLCMSGDKWNPLPLQDPYGLCGLALPLLYAIHEPIYHGGHRDSSGELGTLM
jgi:hypothetical protein